MGTMAKVNILLFLVISSWISCTRAGMLCDVTGGNCPVPLLNSPERQYCCPVGNGQTCCTEEEFLIKVGASVVLQIVLGVLALVVIFICCICCVCCSWCPCYRKRERGAIYGQVQEPRTFVQVIQTPQSDHPSLFSQPPYPAESTGMPQPPPAYSTEAYSKQSPYNPDYPNL